MSDRFTQANRQMQANMLAEGMSEQEFMDVFFAAEMVLMGLLTGLPPVILNLVIHQRLRQGGVEHCLLESKEHHDGLDVYLAEVIEDYSKLAKCSLSEALIRVQARFSENGPTKTLHELFR